MVAQRRPRSPHYSSALASDTNVQRGTVQTTSTCIEWKTVDGTYEGVSTDFLTSSANATLGSPPPVAGAGSGTPAASAATAVAPDDDPASPDPTLNVLLLSPFESSLSQWDPSSSIAADFANAGYTVTLHQNAQVTFSDFQNLGQYDAVNLYGHGTQLPNLGEGVYTSIQSSVSTSAANVWDLLNDAIVIMNGYYVVTPNYITEYAGSMNGTIVEFETCNSLHDTQLGNAFMNMGAGAYLGYSQTVKAGFAAGKATDTWTTLLQATNNTVGDIPEIDTAHDTNIPPAYFEVDGPLSATLPQPNLLKNSEVYIEYDWPDDESDLDTDTVFLGSSVGYNLDNDSPYLDWSGDNTSAGGTEWVYANIYQAWLDGQWTNSTTITAGADWYTPAGGSGPGWITIALVNTKTDKSTYLTNELLINPGQEFDGAMTIVGTINIQLGGDPSDPSVKITLSSPA